GGAGPGFEGSGRMTDTAVEMRTRPLLDYYLIGPDDGIVVEEFVLADDHTVVGLRSTGWTPADRRWWSSAEFSRTMRADPALRARVVAASRAEVEIAYRCLDGTDLLD